MIVNNKELEIAAVGISMAAGCRPCTKFHIKAAGDAGASDEEVADGLNAGVALANAALADLSRQFDSHDPVAVTSLVIEELGRHELLAAIGASVARNDVAYLQATLRVAKGRGIGDGELMEIITLANRIKAKAASHLLPLLETLDADPAVAAAAAGLCT